MSKDDDFSNEVTDFDNFTIELEEDTCEVGEGIEVPTYWITIDDKNGEFYGQYNESKNKKYIVAYCDRESVGEGKSAPGQVYLIEDEKKILWTKKLDRPNHAFVTNDGLVIVVDWTLKEYTGKIYFFDRKGENLFEEKFDSNIAEQLISKDENELIITTCFPEDAIYLFNINNKKLIKKVNNTINKKDIFKINFEDYKKVVSKEEQYIKKTEKVEEIDEEDEELNPYEELIFKASDIYNKTLYGDMDEEVSVISVKYNENEKSIDTSLNKGNRIETIRLNEHGQVIGYGIITNPRFGKISEEKIKSLNEALKLYQEATKMCPKKGSPYKWMGRIYEVFTLYDEAIKFYEKAIILYPQFRKDLSEDIEECKKLKKGGYYLVVKKNEK